MKNIFLAVLSVLFLTSYSIAEECVCVGSELMGYTLKFGNEDFGSYDSWGACETARSDNKTCAFARGCSSHEQCDCRGSAMMGYTLTLGDSDLGEFETWGACTLAMGESNICAAARACANH